MLIVTQSRFTCLCVCVRAGQYFVSYLLLLILPLTIFAGPPNWQQITGTQYSMIAMAKITLYGNIFDGGGSNIAGAFGSGGESDCRSIGSWIELDPSDHDSCWYFTIVGDENGEEITFKIYDEATDTIYSCSPSVTFANNSTIGDPDLLNIYAQESSLSGKIKLVTTTPPEGNIANVKISVGEVIVNPDANGSYHIVIHPGIYDVTSSLDGYTTVTLKDVDIEQNQVTENVDMTLIDWEPISGTQYNMVVIAEVKLNNNIVCGGNNNQLAAFGPDGEDDCRGVATWEGPIEGSWNGFWYFTLVGNEEGEEVNFKLYDSENDKVIKCNETIVFINDATPTEPFIITANMTETLGSEVQNKFELTQNYPNPFNSNTQIEFSLDKRSNVNITVYNLAGQKVRTLVKADLNFGKHCISWDGKNDFGMPVSSGVYLYKVKTDNFCEVKKMILSK